MKSQFVFSFIVYAFGVISKRPLPNRVSQLLPYIFFWELHSGFFVFVLNYKLPTALLSCQHLFCSFFGLFCQDASELGIGAGHEKTGEHLEALLCGDPGFPLPVDIPCRHDWSCQLGGQLEFFSRAVPLPGVPRVSWGRGGTWSITPAAAAHRPAGPQRTCSASVDPLRSQWSLLVDGAAPSGFGAVGPSPWGISLWSGWVWTQATLWCTGPCFCRSSAQAGETTWQCPTARPCGIGAFRSCRFGQAPWLLPAGLLWRRTATRKQLSLFRLWLRPVKAIFKMW